MKSFQEFIAEVSKIGPDGIQKLTLRHGKADPIRTGNDNLFRQKERGQSFIPRTGRTIHTYKGEDDGVHHTVKQWHAENVVKSMGASMTTQHAFLDYAAHCEENQQTPLSIHEFRAQWQKHSGHMMGKLGGQMRHVGVKLDGE